MVQNWSIRLPYISNLNEQVFPWAFDINIVILQFWSVKQNVLALHNLWLFRMFIYFFRRFLNIDYLNRNPLPYLSTITHTQSQRWSNTILVRKRHAYNPNHFHITHKNILLNVYRHHPTVIQYTTLLIIIGIIFFRYTSVIYVFKTYFS